MGSLHPRRVGGAWRFLDSATDTRAGEPAGSAEPVEQEEAIEPAEPLERGVPLLPRVMDERVDVALGALLTF